MAGESGSGHERGRDPFRVGTHHTIEIDRGSEAGATRMMTYETVRNFARCGLERGGAMTSRLGIGVRIGTLAALLLMVVLPAGSVGAAGPLANASLPVHRIGTFVVRDLPAASSKSKSPGRMPLLHSRGVHPTPQGRRPPSTLKQSLSPRLSIAAATPFGAQASFPGLTQADDNSVFGCCIEPPDPWVATGPNAVLQSVNSLIRITDRTGGLKTQIGVDSFFGVLPDQMNVADPRIVYDRAHGRWVGTILSYDCTNGYLYLAVSQTSDPMSGWTGWYFTYSGSLPDYPGLGISSDKVVISANEYPINPNAPQCLEASLSTASLLVMDWGDVLGTLPFGNVYYSEPGYSSWRPATNLTTDPTIHVVGERVSDGDVTYASITGDVANPNAPGPDLNPVSLSGPSDLGALAPFTTPPAPRQPGYPNTIADAVDLRPTDAIWANGSLWFVSTYPLLLDGDTDIRDTVRVTQLLTGASPSVRQDFAIGFVGYDAFMGGIGLASDGTAYIVYSASSAGAYPSTWANMQRTNDPVNTYSSSVLIASGGGSYLGTRWGDYVGVAQDPIAPNAVWVAGEYPNASGGWITRVTQLSIDAAPPTGTVVINGGATATGTSAVSLAIAATDGTSGLKDVLISNNSNMSGASTFLYTTPISWSLVPGDGNRSVYVQWRDNLGNISPIASDSIVVDTIAPTATIGTSSIVGTAMNSTSTIPVRVSWAGNDLGSGMAAFAVARSVDGAPFSGLTLVNPASTSLVTTMAPGHTYRFEVRATDRVGNIGSWSLSSPTSVVAAQETSRTITYGHTWYLQSVYRAYAGRVKYATRASAYAAFRFTGKSIAWIAPKSAGRGSARVYVDGIYRGTVSLYSRVTLARQVVFVRSWTTVGTHTIKIVVVGTYRHPRVDLDAFATLR